MSTFQSEESIFRTTVTYKLLYFFVKFVRSKEQMICIWSSWCHCRPTFLWFIKIQNSLPFWCWLTRLSRKTGR